MQYGSSNAGFMTNESEFQICIERAGLERGREGGSVVPEEQEVSFVGLLGRLHEMVAPLTGTIASNVRYAK